MATSDRIFYVLTLIIVFGLVIPAAISLSNIRSLSLPISKITATATLILPLITGAGILQTQRLITGSNEPHSTHKIQFSLKVLAAIMLLVVYETVIATLALTHMAPPANLACGLGRQWENLYSNKNSAAIRRIQDAYQCCGLHHVKQMAWPFPDKNRGADACVKMFGRQESCFGQWRRDEQVSAGLLFFVAVTTFLIQLFVFFLCRTGSSFFRHPHRGYPSFTGSDGDDESTDRTNDYNNGIRGRIEDSYRDDQEEGADTSNNHVASARGATANVGSTDHGPIVQPSRLQHDKGF